MDIVFIVRNYYRQRKPGMSCFKMNNNNKKKRKVTSPLTKT